MRKFLLLLLVVFLAGAPPCMGEVNYGKGIVFGGNYNTLNWGPEPTGQTSGKVRLCFGGLLNVKLSEEIQLETDILLNWWAAEVKDVNFNLYNLWVLSIPVLFKGEFPAEKAVPFIGIGPEFGWVLSHTVTVEPDIYPEKVEDQKTKTVALTFCGGLDIKAGGGIITPEVRYSWGLTDLSKDPASKNKCNQWLFLLGMKW